MRGPASAASTSAAAGSSVWISSPSRISPDLRPQGVALYPHQSLFAELALVGVDRASVVGPGKDSPEWAVGAVWAAGAGSWRAGVEYSVTGLSDRVLAGDTVVILERAVHQAHAEVGPMTANGWV